jgi:hypothetical protein
MLWFLAIALIWSAGSLMAVSLCVMARRGDEINAALREPAIDALPVDVQWVATLGAPVDAPAHPAPALPIRARG